MFSATAAPIRRPPHRKSASPGVVKAASPRKRATADPSSDAIAAAWRRGLSHSVFEQSPTGSSSQRAINGLSSEHQGLGTDEEHAEDPSRDHLDMDEVSVSPAANALRPRRLSVSYRPRERGMQDTSINMATAFRDHALSRLEDLDPDVSHDTVPEHDHLELDQERRSNVSSERDAEAAEDEEMEVALMTTQANVPRGTKRKSRHSMPPLNVDSDEPEEAVLRKKRSRKSAPDLPNYGLNGSQPTNGNMQPNGVQEARFLGRDMTWQPAEMDDGDDSEPGEGLAPHKPRRSIDRLDYDETSSPEGHGTSYRLREPTDSTSFSQEEEIVDIELERRQRQAEAEELQRRQEDRMRITRLQREERERRQMPPPPSPATVATPQPPGRYLQTPGPSRTRLHALDEEDSFSAYPDSLQPSKGGIRSAGRTLFDLLMAPFNFVVATLQELPGGPWRWAMYILLLVGIFCALLFRYSKARACLNICPDAFTDERAARGLRRLPALGGRNTDAVDVSPDSLNALARRLVKLEQSQSSLMSQHSTLVSKRLSDKQDSDKRLERLEETTRKVDIVKMEKSLEGLKSGVKELHSDLDLQRTRSESLQDKVKADESEIKILKDSVAGALDASHSDHLTSRVNDAVEKLLSPRLAITMDPKSGRLELRREFWDALRNELAGSGNIDDSLRSSLAKRSPQPTEEKDPLRSTALGVSDEVQGLLDQAIEARIQTGALLSQASFRKLLERDVKSAIAKEFSSGLNDRINGNVEDIARDISASYDRKQAALVSRLEVLEKTGGSRTVLRTSKGEDVQSMVEDIVSAALIKHSKDVIARADYALYSAGARVIPDLTSTTYEAHPRFWWQRALAMPFGAGTIRGRPPVVALHPDVSVGSCWSFPGPTGQLGVRLSRSIIVDAVVIEHTAAELALDRRSAPADFEVWGEVDEHAVARLKRAMATGALEKDDEMSGVVVSTPPAPNHVRLAAGRYDASAEATNHIQIFDTLAGARHLDLPVSVVVLKILGLQGDSEFGCLYRFRVLGGPSEKLP